MFAIIWEKYIAFLSLKQHLNWCEAKKIFNEKCVAGSENQQFFIDN
jgi:hypothetical protein